MAVNMRLWHLANKVVALEKKIERAFPAEDNSFRELFMDLLNIINQVRVAAQGDGPKKWYGFGVECDSFELSDLKNYLESKNIHYAFSLSEREK